VLRANPLVSVAGTSSKWRMRCAMMDWYCTGITTSAVILNGATLRVHTQRSFRKCSLGGQFAPSSVAYTVYRLRNVGEVHYWSRVFMAVMIAVAVQIILITSFWTRTLVSVNQFRSVVTLIHAATKLFVGLAGVLVQGAVLKGGGQRGTSPSQLRGLTPTARSEICC